MLMQSQQVELCYMGIEDSKNTFKKPMDFIANPSSSSAGLRVSCTAWTTAVSEGAQRRMSCTAWTTAMSQGHRGECPA